ncbi:MAG: SDR family oxidoreductase [Actinomycetia bacterium]|nr:SDR family oxidoreductase [Actinomycetes bacterium]MCP4963236.1 SDR family oxidoreductase [Actinomycetes bacterium]
MNINRAEPQDFTGRVGLLSGGTQGLGLATARLLRDRGASGLLLVGRDEAKAEAAAVSLATDQCRVVGHSADVGTVDGCDSVIDRLDAEFGTCHALVNCAAKTDRGTVWDTTPEIWDGMYQVNVRGPALLSQGVAKIMRRQGVDGSIVMIGSVALHGGQDRLLAYSTSKSALVAMTRSLAFQLMRHRIRVNLLNPGWMDTPAEDITQRTWEGAQDGWLEAAEAGQPWGKLIKPDEIARTIVHLATPDSGMLSGAIIDWDQSVLGAGEPARPGPELGPQETTS